MTVCARLIGNSAQVAEERPGRGTEASTKTGPKAAKRQAPGVGSGSLLASMFARSLAQCTVPGSLSLMNSGRSRAPFTPQEGACRTRCHVQPQFSISGRAAHSQFVPRTGGGDILRIHPDPTRRVSAARRIQGTGVQGPAAGMAKARSRLLGAQFSASRREQALPGCGSPCRPTTRACSGTRAPDNGG